MLKEKTKNEIRQLVSSTLCKKFIIGLALLTGITGLSLVGIYVSLKRIVTERIAAQFEEPRIRQTLTEVAASQAKGITKDVIGPEIKRIKGETNKELESFRSNIESFKDNYNKEYSLLIEEINKLKNEINLFRTYLDDSGNEFSEEYDTLANQIVVLEDRNKLVEFADRAIADGDSKAFEYLKNYIDNPIRKELLNAARAEMLRVKNFYVGTTRIKGLTIAYTDPEGKKFVDEEIPTKILLRDLANHSDWRIRTKAAQLLKKRKEKNVPEALLGAINKDPKLDVRKNSLDAFESITGFQSSDVLDYEPAIKWWNENKQEIEKELQGQN